MATGKEIASKVPPPDKLVKGMGGDYAPDDEEKADDDAAALGLMEEFISAVKSGDASAALEAYRNVKDAC